MICHLRIMQFLAVPPGSSIKNKNIFKGRARDQVLKFKLRTKSHVNVTLPPLLKRAFRKYTITVTMHSILFSTYSKSSI